MAEPSNKDKKQNYTGFFRTKRACWFWVGLLAVLFAGNLFLTFYYLHKSQAPPAKSKDQICVPDQNSGAALGWLNPQLQFTAKPVINKAGYVRFQETLSGTIDKIESKGQVTDVAVFFRDLNNGPTFGINSTEDFIPASLLKLPLLMTYYRLAEDDPSLLGRQLATDKFTINLDQNYPPPEILQEGKQYQVEDLLHRMIAYSDNQAWELLWDYLWEISPDKDLLLETYNELGMFSNEPDTIDQATLSAKSYASIFRLLFNASYLSKEYSEKALAYLTEAQFKDGLNKGVPANIPIAHKFGERFDNNIIELHDCGIVYYPANPYLLCVMTKGKDLVSLSETIGTISKAVYEEFDSRKLPD